MAQESGGSDQGRDEGHKEHFRQLSQEGKSWSGREPNVLFQNRGDGTFDEVGNLVGLAKKLDSRGAATADLDGDGDLDLVVYNRNNPTVVIYRNDAPEQGRTLLVDLVPKAGGTTIGAQAIARCGEATMLRQIEAGSGFLSQSPSTVHFGLGDCSALDSLEVRWPSGEVETWSDVAGNSRVSVVQGETGLVASELRERNYNAGQVLAAEGTISAPVPEMELAGFDDADALELTAWSDDGSQGGPSGVADTLFINFWATWCIPCRAEMPDIQALHEEFGPRGVGFYGIVMDEADQAEAVREFLSKNDITYAQVWGDSAAQEPFTTLGNAPAGSVPTTAIIHRGFVRQVVAGTIDAEATERLLEALLAEPVAEIELESISRGHRVASR